jgi:hypothetical protein
VRTSTIRSSYSSVDIQGIDQFQNENKKSVWVQRGHGWVGRWVYKNNSPGWVYRNNDYWWRMSFTRVQVFRGFTRTWNAAHDSFTCAGVNISQLCSVQCTGVPRNFTPDPGHKQTWVTWRRSVDFDFDFRFSQDGEFASPRQGKPSPCTLSAVHFSYAASKK